MGSRFFKDVFEHLDLILSRAGLHQSKGKLCNASAAKFMRKKKCRGPSAAVFMRKGLRHLCTLFHARDQKSMKSNRKQSKTMKNKQTHSKAIKSNRWQIFDTLYAHQWKQIKSHWNQGKLMPIDGHGSKIVKNKNHR